MRLVEAAHPEGARIGQAQRPVDEPVRFAQEPSLAFAPSAVAAFETSAAGAAPRLVQRVFGLFGPNGALPIHLTDWARDRARNSGDTAFVRFLDVFHHRMLSLFYRAWAQAQAAVSMDRPRQDFFGRRLAALCGLGAPSLRNRDAVPDTVKLAHAGVFGRQVRSAECLQIVLANYFRVPVQIEEFVGHWLWIAPEQRSRLGGRGGFNCLGEDAVLGERTWHAQSRFRVLIGPLSFRDYERFLPRGRSSRALHDLIRLYVGMEHSWEVKLVLKKNEVPLAWLGNSVWVGWSSWLGARLTERDAADYSNTQGRHLPHWDAQAQPHQRVDEEAPEPQPEPHAQVVQ
jgi:type VI secretion system protein ImpH